MNAEVSLSPRQQMEDICEEAQPAYIYFELADEQNPATWIIDVISDDGDNITLGQIKWYAHWRQYGFFPKEGTVYEKTCLTDITNFVKTLNAKQKEGLKPENPQRTL